MTFRAALLLAVVLSAPARAQEPVQVFNDPVMVAKAQAFARQQPMLVEFHAAWCYSCYYMARNVLTGPEWERAGRELVKVELDADSPEGAHWMKEWNVKVMPTFLLFGSDGDELGRILGEQTRDDFYSWLFSITEHGSTLEAMKARVVDGSKSSVVAGAQVLKTFHARFDAEGGLAWFAAQPKEAKTALARDEPAATWVARLELLRAASANETMACAQVGEAVLGSNLGCERPYELGRVMECTSQQTLAERGELLLPQAGLMQLLFEKRVLGELRCADERSIVLKTADLMAALGEPEREKKILDQAIEDLKRRMGGDLKKDRTLSDNLRVYLERAGRSEELDKLLLQLIDAYPEDYVYAYRYGKILASRGKHEEALKYFEKASTLAYGENRMRNTEWYARSLIAVGKKVEAWKMLSAVIDADGPFFPATAAQLEAIKKELSEGTPGA